MSESNTAEEAASEEAPEVFQNRAARRAKGKKDGTGQTPTAQSAGGFHGRSSVPGRRQYGSRRTGG